MSYLARNVDSSKPLDPPGKECPGSGLKSQHGPAPPFKRQRNQEDHPSDSGQSEQNPLINEATGNMFYKTRLCKKPDCSNGEICNFAHDLKELHHPPPNWRALLHASGNQALDNDRRIRKMTCWHFTSENGCAYGEHCRFLHLSPNKTRIARQSELMTPGPQRMNMSITGKNVQPPFNSGVPIEDASPAKVTETKFLNSGGPIEDASPAKVTETKFLNWRPPRKIAGIYGDWPEGYSLPDNN